MGDFKGFELGRWGVNVVRTPYHQEEGAFLRVQNAEPQTNQAQKGLGKRLGIATFTADLGDAIMALANINLVPEISSDPDTGEPQSLGDFGPAALNTMRIKAYLSTATTSVPNTTETTVSFDSEVYDVGNVHDLLTNPSRFTVPTGGDGLYLVIGTAKWAASATGIRSTRLYLNGTALLAQNDHAAGTTDLSHVQVQAVVPLAAADYLEMKVWQSSAGALNLLGSDEAETSLTILRVLATVTTVLPRCQAVRTADLSLGNGVATAIALDGEAFDTHTMHDNSVNNTRITIPAQQGGAYLMIGQFALATAFNGAWKADLRKNGATLLATSRGIGGNIGGQDVTGQVEVYATMVPTDYVELVITQTAVGGGAHSILGGGLNTTNLQVARVG